MIEAPMDTGADSDAGGRGVVRAAFGLRISSAIDLPELALAPADGRAPDVDVALGAVAERLEGSTLVPPLMQVAGARFQLDAPAGRFRVLEGRRVIVDPRADATAAEIRLYLLGTVMGALMHQVGRLPLHAAVLASGHGAAAFAGHSGAGKSTLAAQWLRGGGTVLADDLCAVETGPVERPPLGSAGDGGLAWPRVYPGLARIKLWPDSLALAGIDGSGLPPLAPSIDKVSLATPAPAGDPVPLRRLYILRPGGEPAAEIRPLTGPEAVFAVLDSVYRWPIAVAMGSAAASQWAACVALASGCEVFEATYCHDPERPRLLCEALIHHWGNTA